VFLVFELTYYTTGRYFFQLGKIAHFRTVIVASITTNLTLAEAPGNVFLEKGESGLSKEGVVNISQISTIDKKRLTEKVCVLAQSSISEIDYGLKLVLNIQ